ncbi:double-strand break repair protein AddB [uncultured Roseovarius sp.]|uniref:double-strand break repair protein AddB n=1 Tax=uncultured Roseovarius sp. TaxID=293344 RepID=UPI0026386A86|nr:double-strand break repair protein AddB [uncultured Roseovarius sp.]
MFDPSDRPRLFGVPPGVDFPRALVEGLRARHAGQPPEALARVHLIVNTRRMARRIRDLFDQGPPCLLPRISLLTDLGEMWDLAHIPDPVPPLRRRLELVQLISALLDRTPDLAPRSAIFDLADSLAGLMDEMHGEGVTPQVIEALDVSDQSGHWARIQSFLAIVQHYFEAGGAAPDVETRQRLVIERLADLWSETPPEHPVLLAGSTGSRGATQHLMQAVARLPQGAVILPGHDFDMPSPVWDSLGDAMLSEDHPQYRSCRVAAGAGLRPDQIQRWCETAPPNPARNAVISLALRPAPVTDQWLRDGPRLRDIDAAMADITLVEAPSLRHEALAIAMRLRQAAEDGRTAALITPDRMLTRQVTAALDRWDILPDDSAGQPLHLSAPGRFLRHVADLFRNRLSAEALLTLLKHPLTHQGTERGTHLRLTRELELHLRRHGPPYPTADSLHSWAASEKDALAPDWVHWLCACFIGRNQSGEVSLDTLVAAHVALAEQIAQGCREEGSGTLWLRDAGQEAQKAIAELQAEAGVAGALSATDYASLFHGILSAREVRNPVDPHPHILIWGTLEARVQGADILILAGLNEGSWPEAPTPDPWLNRALRHQAGLLLPERRIGLSAHDFQQAVAAPEVWLTRSVRSADAETVVSRWLNRIMNLLGGLPEQGGPEAVTAMRARGGLWLERAAALEEPGDAPRAPRPAPCPPLAARPDHLTVTEIKRLIRDPYAIYARHILNLRPLDPLMRTPDALLRGTVLHEILEGFIRETLDDSAHGNHATLMRHAEAVLADKVPWAEARALWLARLERVADWFIETEARRRAEARPVAFEASGRATMPDLDFTLSAKADRLDLDDLGRLHIYDYKTGAPPSTKEQTSFDKQLLLEAAIAHRAGFGDMGPSRVARAVFIGLGSEPKEVEAPLDTEPPEKIWAEFHALIAAYMEPSQGYTSRRAPRNAADQGDYDQLARYGEWEMTDPPDASEVGQ